MGTTLLPTMARLALTWMNKQKLDPKDLSTAHLNVIWRRKDQR
jgi:hypothetical protein